MAKLLSLDHDFHLTIARAARNHWLYQAAFTARVEMFRPVGSVFNAGGEKFNDLHDDIVDAIERQDSSAAEQLMTTHILDAESRVEALLNALDR